MEEEADADARQLIPDQIRQQHQVVVVNPQDIVRPGHFQQRRGEDIVDSLVLQPEVFVVSGVGGKVMEKRPDGLIAKALVEILEIFFG